MGFPTWTLWGMGLAGFGALIAIALAFIAQTPRLLNRLGLVGHRIDLRARTYTGYAFALLLLSMGFFLAGVPLGVPAGDGETAETPATAEALSEAAGQLTPETTRVLTQTITGAVMGGVSATDAPVDEAPASLDAGVAPAGSPEPVETPVISATIPLTPSTGSLSTRTPPPITETPTPFPTATLTPTPSPTVTPTPIDGATARVGDNTSVLPVNRTPGGQILATIYRGDTVIVLPGHAFHTGNTWRQISTVNGVVGWVPEQFLDYGVGAE